MKDKTLYNLHANICNAIANPIRLEIIDILSTREMTFGDILNETAVLKSNLSQHLSLMVTS
ncbi:MAG: ArsR family transcriptional regulator [Bacteroidales bacterium]|jgi:ArsR family transcriptional regulator|nr:ArsR family transcriptional regulator [Bacteroidales bacterium]